MIVAAAPAFSTRHANPYNALLYEAIVEQGVTVREYAPVDLLRTRPDIVHLHWPELLLLSSHRAWQNRLRLASFELLIRLARLRGTRLVWTVHNDGAHEGGDSPALQRRMERMLARTVDGVFTLSGAGEVAFRDRFGPDIPVFRTPHGHYRDAYPLDAEPDAARATLGIDAGTTLLAAVGQVRPYKNLPALLAAARAIEDPRLRVAVAGRPASAAEGSALRAAAGDDPRLLLELERLDDERMGTWLRAADAVVLPYRRILNSGAAILALSAGRPVIVPAIGAMPELAEAVGDRWVYLYEGEITPAVLEGALHWLRSAPRPVRPDLSALDWPPIAAATIAGYRIVVADPRRRTR